MPQYRHSKNARRFLAEFEKDTELADLGAEMYSMGNLYGGPGDTLIIGKTTGIDSYDIGTGAHPRTIGILPNFLLIVNT